MVQKSALLIVLVTTLLASSVFSIANAQTAAHLHITDSHLGYGEEDNQPILSTVRKEEFTYVGGFKASKGLIEKINEQLIAKVIAQREDKVLYIKADHIHNHLFSLIVQLHHNQTQKVHHILSAFIDCEGYGAKECHFVKETPFVSREIRRQIKSPTFYKDGKTCSLYKSAKKGIDNEGSPVIKTAEFLVCSKREKKELDVSWEVVDEHGFNKNGLTVYNDELVYIHMEANKEDGEKTDILATTYEFPKFEEKDEKVKKVANKRVIHTFEENIINIHNVDISKVFEFSTHFMVSWTQKGIKHRKRGDRSIDKGYDTKSEYVIFAIDGKSEEGHLNIRKAKNQQFHLRDHLTVGMKKLEIDILNQKINRRSVDIDLACHHLLNDKRSFGLEQSPLRAGRVEGFIHDASHEERLEFMVCDVEGYSRLTRKRVASIDLKGDFFTKIRTNLFKMKNSPELSVKDVQKDLEVSKVGSYRSRNSLKFYIVREMLEESIGWDMNLPIYLVVKA